MPRKIILTQNFDFVFTDKLIGVKVIDGDTYYNRPGNKFGDDGVIIATDINGNEIYLGEYEDYFKARDIVEDMMYWLVTNSDLNPFDVICDDKDFDDDVECQRRYIMNDRKNIPYSKFFKSYMSEMIKTRKADKKDEHTV